MKRIEKNTTLVTACFDTTKYNPNGHTYDKSSIRYIKNNISPLTKLPINTKTPIPNRLIKGFIDKFIFCQFII